MCGGDNRQGDIFRLTMTPVITGDSSASGGCRLFVFHSAMMWYKKPQSAVKHPVVTWY
ncbi:hypothetical protein [Morganella morganii IS15]|nr:hypothetical protein [Morganella morganii IS15]